MSFFKSMGVAALTLSAVISALPLVASAQSYPTGSVQVYFQIADQDKYGHAPSDFFITIVGQNPSQTTLSGSQTGTVVNLGVGPYSVTASSAGGLMPSYSAGCSGTVQQFQTATCIITESSTPGLYNQGTQPYLYPCSLYGSQANCTNPYVTLACVPSVQSVAAGQSATFTATGGSGVYTWATPDRTYVGIGSQLTTMLSTVGRQIVTVSSNGQSATCVVNVTGVGGPAVTSTYVPSLPNTGFAPAGAAGAAFAVVLLVAMAIVLLPYAKKATFIARR